MLCSKLRRVACGALIKSARPRNALGNNLRFLALPAHQVVGMPALSPTMTSGTIGKWTCKVGDKISAGDSLAEVETDKASVTFESQEDFVVAKFLVDVGAEVKVGDPILVTVEDASNVAAFADFKVAAPAATAPAPATPVAPPAPVKAAPVATPVPVATPPAPKPVSTTATTVAPPAQTAPKAVTPAAASTKSSGTPSAVYGAGAVKGALARKLAVDQAEYIKKYGRQGHIPLKVGK